MKDTIKGIAYHKGLTMIQVMIRAGLEERRVYTALKKGTLSYTDLFKIARALEMSPSHLIKLYEQKTRANDEFTRVKRKDRNV